MRRETPATHAAPTDPAWAWSPLVPDARSPWDLRRVGHLFRRAAFGASAARQRQALDEGPARTVERLVRPDDATLSLDTEFDRYEQHAIDRDAASVDALRDWWLRRMIETRHPLREMMTLFWHDHFAASNSRVKNGWLMARHVRVLRENALARLQPLLLAMARDPAILLTCDAAVNRKTQPETGLARRWLDRFTLGPGRATYRDVRETARAFTGRFVLRNEYRDLAHEHDDGSKTVLGSTGPWADADVVRITAAHPATALHLTRRLYRWFVSETEDPPDSLLAPLADRLAADGEIGRTVETILRSNLFFADRSYRTKIKSPVTLAVGIVRAFDSVVPTTVLAGQLAELGQDLGQPPTSEGWTGRSSWINWATMAGRINVASLLLNGEGPYAGKIEPAAALRGRPPARAAVDLLLDGVLPDHELRRVTRAGGDAQTDPVTAWKRVVRPLVFLPEFHLA